MSGRWEGGAAVAMDGLDDLPAPGARPSSGAGASGFDDDDDDGLFEFTNTLKLPAEDGNGDGDGDGDGEDLPPLEDGVEDLLGDRGVLLRRLPSPASASGTGASDKERLCASESNPYVEVHYEGYVCSTDKKFDSTRDQNYPLIALLDLPPSGNSTLIRGWEVAFPHIRQGEHVELTVASRYAYGESGVEPDIPPNSDLRFEIEVLDVRATQKRVQVVDNSKDDMSRLEEVRREREIAQQRRMDEEKLKQDRNEGKVDRVAELQAKLAAKKAGKGAKKGAKKKKK